MTRQVCEGSLRTPGPQGYLRLYTLVALFRDSLTIYQRFFWPLLSIALVFLLPFALLSDLTVFAYPILGPIQIFAGLLLPYVAHYALVGEIAEVCFGETVSLRRATARLSTRGIGRLLGTVILAGLVALLWSAGAQSIGALVALAWRAHIGWIIYLAAAAGGLLAARKFVHYIFVPQIVILERKYWRSALRRSRQIVQLRPWRSAAFFVLQIVIVQVPLAILFFALIYLAEGRLSAERMFSGPSSSFAGLGTNMLGSVLETIIAPFLASLVTLYYFSLRIEAFDLTKEQVLDIRTFSRL